MKDFACLLINNGNGLWYENRVMHSKTKLKRVAKTGYVYLTLPCKKINLRSSPTTDQPRSHDLPLRFGGARIQTIILLDIFRSSTPIKRQKQKYWTNIYARSAIQEIAIRWPTVCSQYATVKSTLPIQFRQFTFVLVYPQLFYSQFLKSSSM